MKSPHLLISGIVGMLCWSLSAAAEESYKPDAGPFGVVVAHTISIQAPDGTRAVPLRVTYPDGSGSFPLVVLSHGGGCAGGSYGAVGNHWTSHGYVVIQPTHPDSVSLGFDMAKVGPREMEGIVRRRVEDMSIIIDQINEIEAAIPQLAGNIDAENVVAAGHSMGAATALTATGMVLQNPFSRQFIKSEENRYDAVLLLSEPGHNPTLPDEPWQSVDLPTFIYTGTNDRGSQSGENSNIPFQYDIVNKAPDPASAKHYLWVDGVDHFLGGAWCRPAESFDQEGLSVLRGVSTAFLDAYAKGSEAARSFLLSGSLPGKAGSRPTLSQR